MGDVEVLLGTVANLTPTSNVSHVFTLLSTSTGSTIIAFVWLCTIGLAVGFNAIRTYIFKDEDSLDLSFDAGGKVSMGLTAATIVSQWTWAATLLQSSGVGTKYGISGPFWYASGATIQILLFACIAVKLKVRAPGAKTFLQVVRSRFGKKAHKVYCGYALVTNMIVTAMLMLGGCDVMVKLIKDLSITWAALLCTAIIASFTLVGGLGATFYTSYFNTCLIFVGIFYFIILIFVNPLSDGPVGSIDKVYELLRVWEGPEGNEERSFLTLVSSGGLMFGIINIIGNFGTVFVDQAYWQSSVAAKPKEGVVGFLMGGVVWFAVPFGFATTMGLGYLALSSHVGESLLYDDEVGAGLVPVAVASFMGGYSGHIVLIMILMAVVSTGSAEVVAVGSIMIYDIYMVYIRPFRIVSDDNQCILCGKARGRKATKIQRCQCESMVGCPDCDYDNESV